MKMRRYVESRVEYNRSMVKYNKIQRARKAKLAKPVNVRMSAIFLTVSNIHSGAFGYYKSTSKFSERMLDKFRKKLKDHL